MHVSGLFVYPVKSLQGYAVEALEFDEVGPKHDRRFLVIDASGRMLTQRVEPRMVAVDTRVTGDTLTLSAAGAGSIEISTRSEASAPMRTVTVWKSEGLQAEDCGDAVASWLSGVLGQPCRLVRAGAAFRRVVTKKAAVNGDIVGFADAVPALVIAEASLHDLNDRLVAKGEDPVPMDRFRPNIVVADAAPFAEDTWPRVHIGGVTFRAAGPCSRCIMVTTDQKTGERGKEPLRTLATYRRDLQERTEVNFGQNLIHETKTGVVRVGDAVVVG